MKPAPVTYSAARREIAAREARLVPGSAESVVPGRVVAVIVTFHPCMEGLRRLLNALLPQVFAILIIDNGSDESDIEGLLSRHCGSMSELVRMGRNLGLGRAHNEGIERARAWRSEYVLLMDQDSVPDLTMVDCLRDALETREDAAAAGPAYNAQALGRRSGFVSVRGLRMHRKLCDATSDVLEVDHLIASGSLIPMRVFDRVGGLRNDLFIDYVDIEWGLRARASGMSLYGVCGARMHHRLGDDCMRIMGHSIPQYSSNRIYYQVRNSLLLLRESFIPLNWKLVNVRQVLLRCLAHILRVRPVRQYLKMIGLAISHGIRGRSGSFEHTDPKPKKSKSKEMV